MTDLATDFRATLALLFFISGFWSSPASAQQIFVPGYVITLDGDTLHGEIDFQNWKKNPSRIEFRKDSEKEVQTFLPAEISGAVFKNFRFVSAFVEIETSPYKVAELKKDSEMHIEKISVFLRTIITGEKSLYYFKDSRGKEHFYFRIDQDFVLFRHKRYLIDKDHKVLAKSINTYRNQLAFYLSDCQYIQSKLNSIDYELRDFKRIYKAFYSCMSRQPEFFEEKDLDRFKFGILAGATMSTINFTGPGDNYLAQVDFSYSVNFTAGFFMEILLPNGNNKWTVNNEVTYTSYNVTGDYSEVRYASIYDTYLVNFGSSQINVNNMLRYKLLNQRLKFFFDLGFSNSMALSVVNHMTHKRDFFGTLSMEESEAISHVNSYELGALAGAGFRYGNFTAAARYDLGTAMSTFANSYRYTFLLGYYFN